MYYEGCILNSNHYQDCMSRYILRGMLSEYDMIIMYVTQCTTRDAFWNENLFKPSFLKTVSKHLFKTPFQNTFQNIFWKYHLKHLFKTSFKNIFQNIFSKHLLKHLFKILFHWNTLKTFMHWNRIYRAFGLVLFYNLGTWRHYILSSALGDTGQSWTQHHW